MRYTFGEKIREIRDRRGFSIKEVSSRAGVSESLISQIERNKISPSLDTLLTIMDILGIDMEYLFRDYKQERQVKIVRKEERNVYTTPDTSYEVLSVLEEKNKEHSLEAFHLTIIPGGRRGSGEYGHPGSEMGIILEGEGLLEYGKQTYVLNEGDSVTFSSDTPHILSNTGAGELIAIWIITPPRMIFGQT